MILDIERALVDCDVYLLTHSLCYSLCCHFWGAKGDAGIQQAERDGEHRDDHKQQDSKEEGSRVLAARSTQDDADDS